MENNHNGEVFQYTYSAKEQEELQQIRNKYIPNEESKMAQIRRLDEGVTKKATMASLVAGLIGTLILGVGMSLAMTDLGAAMGLGTASMVVGVIIGIVGMVFVGVAYPIYFRKLKEEREKIAPEILRLTDELIK